MEKKTETIFCGWCRAKLEKDLSLLEVGDLRKEQCGCCGKFFTITKIADNHHQIDPI